MTPQLVVLASPDDMDVTYRSTGKALFETQTPRIDLLKYMYDSRMNSSFLTNLE